MRAAGLLAVALLWLESAEGRAKRSSQKKKAAADYPLPDLEPPAAQVEAEAPRAAAAEGGAAAAAAPKKTDSANPLANPKVIAGDLTRGEFIELSTSDLSVIYFYAEWCEPCKAFAPEWEQAVERLAALDPPIKAGRMDAENNEQIAGRYNITKYPGIAVFRRGSHYLIPTEEFSADGIVDHLQHQSRLAAPTQPSKTVRGVEKLSQSVWKWDDHSASVAIIVGLFPKGADSPPKSGQPPAPGARELELFGAPLAHPQPLYPCAAPSAFS